MIREDVPADHEAISQTIVAAFGQIDEAHLVRQLRDDGDLVLSLVNDDQGSITGHIALSAMSAMANGRKLRALGLAPVSVLPEFQRKGIGKALINAAIAYARQSGIQIIFLLGDPAYYGKFGFSVENAKGFASPYAGPYWQANILDESLQLPMTGAAEYARAFQALG